MFLVGGATRDPSTGAVVSLTDVDHYNPGSDQWTHITDLDTPRHNAGATAMGQCVCVCVCVCVCLSVCACVCVCVCVCVGCNIQ
jgi:hypothetical protein